jgi:hypothetical protein
MKKNYALLLFFIFSQFISAQISFNNVEVTDFTEDLESFIFADINNDGHQDIIGVGSDGVDWYQNTGVDGQFRRKNSNH